jgi:hypothetical protein
MTLIPPAPTCEGLWWGGVEWSRAEEGAVVCRACDAGAEDGPWEPIRFAGEWERWGEEGLERGRAALWGRGIWRWCIRVTGARARITKARRTRFSTKMATRAHARACTGRAKPACALENAHARTCRLRISLRCKGLAAAPPSLGDIRDGHTHA